MDIKAFGLFLQNCNREKQNLQNQYDEEIKKANESKKLLDRVNMKLEFAEQLYSKIFNFLMNCEGSGVFSMKLKLQGCPLFDLYDNCNTLAQARQRIYTIVQGMGFLYCTVEEYHEEGSCDTAVTFKLFDT